MLGQARGRTVLAVNLAEEEQTRRSAIKAISRAQRVTRGLGRWGLWGSILLFAGLYCVLAGIASCRDIMIMLDYPRAVFFGPWSLVAMTLVPLWASLLVLVSCATAFPLERAAGTLDELRLTPLPVCALQRALTGPRLRFGLVVLLIALPFYLLPNGMASRLHPLVVARGYFLLHLNEYVWALARYGRRYPEPFCYGLLILAVDVTRLYAMAAIGTMASLRARSVGAAVFWAVAGASAFLAVTVGAEWAGISALQSVSSRSLWPMQERAFERAFWLVSPAAVALEAGVINLLLPWLLLRWARRRGEEWLAREG